MATAGEGTTLPGVKEPGLCILGAVPSREELTCMGKLIIRLGGGLPRIELVVMGGGGGGWFIMVAPYRQTVTSLILRQNYLLRCLDHT